MIYMVTKSRPMGHTILVPGPAKRGIAEYEFGSNSDFLLSSSGRDD